MIKFLAILNVIAWMGFWAFGYIALTAGDLSTGQITIAVLLAAVGFFIGMMSYVRISHWAAPHTYTQKLEG